MYQERKSRHPLKILKLYSQYLSGASDDDLLNSGVSGVSEVSEAELVKIKQFHALVSKNKKLLALACETGINQAVAKRLLKMYEAHVRGEPVSHCPKRTQIKLAFRMLLDGFSDSEIIEVGCTSSDIDSAKKFLDIAPEAEKMLLHTLGQKICISRHAVARMLKIYRDKQAEMMKIEEMHDNRIPIMA